MAYCVEDRKPVKHWICVTSKGRIFLKNHPDVSLQAIKAEASFGCCCGCFWAITNILLDEDSISKIQHHYNELKGSLVAENFSSNLAQFISSLHYKRAQRKRLKELHALMEMKPFEKDIVYRVKLLNERFAYRTDSIVRRLLAKKQHEVSFVEEQRLFIHRHFITPGIRGPSGVIGRGWDY
jgi:hypothetical protein